MRILLLAALLLMAAGPAAAQRTCDQYKGAITAVPVASPVERVPGIAGKRIYLCGYIVMPSSDAAGQAVEFELTRGTGTNCAANRQVMIPRIRVPAGGIINRTPFATGETTAAGEAVCLQTWGTGSITSIFYWAQF